MTKLDTSNASTCGHTCNAFWVIHVSNARLSDPDTAWVHTTQYPFPLRDLGSHIFWSSTSQNMSMSNHIDIPPPFLVIFTLQPSKSIFCSVGPSLTHLFAPRQTFEIFGGHRTIEINLWWMVVVFTLGTILTSPDLEVQGVTGCEIPQLAMALEWENHRSKWGVGV